MENGLFDVDFRLEALSGANQLLPRLDKLIPWETFRPTLNKIREKERLSTAGRRSFDVVMMFKIMILQSLFNLSDEAVEYQIMDRLSFMNFLGLNLGSKVPDARTIWLFREQLKSLDLTRELFNNFDDFLRVNGFVARRGQIVDATIVPMPIQRQPRNEKSEGEASQNDCENTHKPVLTEAQKRHQEHDANFTKKHGKTYYGVKNHIQIDVENKIIRKYEVTPAATHDSQVFEQLLDPENSNAKVYADSAYNSSEHRAALKNSGYNPQLQRRAFRNTPLKINEIKGNKTRGRIRARIEHVFGIQLQRAKKMTIYTVGIIRATTKIGLRNIAYNLSRYAFLCQNAN